MITVYFFDGTAIGAVCLAAGDPLPAPVLWVDLLQPTPEEEDHIERELGIRIPTREQIWKNETLNRFYEENGVHYMTSAVITKVDSPYPSTSAITFVMTRDYLLTLRHITPTSFQVFTGRIAKRPHKFTSGARVLEGLLEEIISRVAYNAENVVGALDHLSHHVFGAKASGARRGQVTTSKMQDILMELGKNADLNSKINESLHSLSRMLFYFAQVNGEADLAKSIQTLETDIRALIQQTAFLSDKITFLLDTTLGMINVEQNLIIKLFSVVTVFMLPPTLVAGI